MARRFILVFFMCLVAATFGCSPLRLRHNERAASVAVIQRFLGNRLCTKELANPDTSPDTAGQRRFEKLLVEAGIMHRTVAGGSIGYVIPAESHYTTRVTRHRSRKFGEILEVCFGTIEVSKVEILGESRFGTNERVTIVPHLLPWVRPFRRRLQFPEMPFQVDVVVADQTVSMNMVSVGFNWRKIFWPIGGKVWYQGMYPAALQGPRDRPISI